MSQGSTHARSGLRRARRLGMAMLAAGTLAQPAVAQDYSSVLGDSPGSSNGVSAPWRGGRHAGPLPSHHVVHQGDTLWDITGYYFGNPWDWPRVWSINPEIANPHWIYPDERVRLQEGAESPTPASSGARVTTRGSTNASRMRVRAAGYIDEEALDNDGRIVGSPSERMMLSSGDEIWVRYEDDDERPARGTELTIYRAIPRNERDDDERGDLVRILGTAVVRSFDEDRGVVRAEIVESLEPIERGFHVAEAPSQFSDVPPVRNERDLDTTVAATLYPRDIVGDQQYVFIELGEDDGVRVGNRFFVVREADPFYDSMDGNPSHAVSATGRTSPESGTEYPPEVIAEARVVDIRPHSATLLVTRAVSEISVGDALQMREGF